MRKSKVDALRALATVFVVCSAAPCYAEVLTVRFETYGESAPSVLCVVSTPAVGATQTGENYVKGDEIDRYLEHELSRFPPATECGTKTDPLDVTKRYRVQCEGARAKTNRGVVLLLNNSSVSSVGLSQNVGRIEFVRARNSHGTIDVKVLGGSYQPQSDVPTALTGDSESVDFSLIPLCVSRVVAIPEHRCNGLEAEAYKHSSNVRTDGPIGTRHVSIVIDNQVQPHGSFWLSHCGTRFSADWGSVVPPREIRLEVTDFAFRWQTSCLAPERACPGPPKISGVGVSCERKPHIGFECEYVCSGATRFPTSAEFAIQEGSVTQLWTESLLFPGQILAGYVPPDQRRLKLSWSWDAAECDAAQTRVEECLGVCDRLVALLENPDKRCAKQQSLLEACLQRSRQARADRPGDKIDYVELRSPEGHLYRVRHDTHQVRMPELDCDDYITYRYIGTRVFDEKLVPTQASVSVLPDPSESRRDRFGVGAGLGGGEQHISGAGWGAQGEIQAILVFRHLRDLAGALIWQRLDIEARIAGVVAGQSYCSHFSQKAEAKCAGKGSGADWDQIVYWRIPVTVGPTYYLGDDFRIGFGFGPALTTFSWAQDSGKAYRPVLFAAHMHLGILLSRAIGVEAYMRLFSGERVRQTVFDPFGVAGQGVYSNASSASVFFGLLLRVDNLL
jgi:hypothetical protein